MNIKFKLAAALPLLCLLTATMAVAADGAGREIATAAAHAEMAAAGGIDMAHAHLHHVINCLVGPKGRGFDAAAGNPCKGMGDGALNDSGHSPAVRAQLEEALRIADRALRSNKAEELHRDAVKIADVLKGAQAPVK